MSTEDLTPFEQDDQPIELIAELTDHESSALDEALLEHASEEVAERTPIDQAASVGKVVAGAAIAAVGVPMLVLPGPGVAAIAVGGLVAAKGASELSGKENPFVSQIEEHPEYQAAAQKAKDATDSVTSAVTDAAKEVPGVVAGAGKAVLDAVDSNLPENVRGAVDNVTPVIKGAADAAAPIVDAAGKGLEAGFKAIGDFAEGVLKRK